MVAPPAFYQVQLSQAEVYVDLGLTLTKLGEEALVPLKDFSLEGPHRKDLRQSLRNAENQGWIFEIISPEEVPQILEKIHRVSLGWLQNRKEKSFSLGGFSFDYLKLFALAVVKNQAGDYLAFANIWPQSSRTELSIDLMRHVQPCPKGLMDFLFTNLLLEGKKQGYAYFNLGMAPLSGIENRPYAPRWNRLAAFIYRHGQRFYTLMGCAHISRSFGRSGGHCIWRPRVAGDFRVCFWTLRY
jgi:phosphatidylglycerol lysyltransferase